MELTDCKLLFGFTLGKPLTASALPYASMVKQKQLKVFRCQMWLELSLHMVTVSDIRCITSCLMDNWMAQYYCQLDCIDY